MPLPPEPTVVSSASTPSTNSSIWGGAGNPHILQIVIKNTSTMDFTLPLLWKIRKESPQAKISILYCVSDKRQIVRNGNYFSGFFKENRIPEYDFGHFLKPPFRWLEPLWRRCFKKTYADKDAQFRKWGAFVTSPWRFLVSLVQSAAHRLEFWLGTRLVDTKSILGKLKPDIVLFDNRSTATFYGKKHLYDYLDKNRIPVVLLPHAPHYIGADDLFVPFDPEDARLPAYCDVWIPLQREDFNESQTGAIRSQLFSVGYPGFDSEWISNELHRDKPADARRSSALVCLVITRKFLPKGVKRPKNMDPFTLDYDEVLGFLNNIGNAIQRCPFKVEVILKPHPSSHFRMTEEIVAASTLSGATISHEPFYDLLPGCDVAISPFSTSLLLPAVAGIPVIVVESPLQRYVHAKWDRLRDLYEGLRFYLKDPDGLSDALKCINNSRSSETDETNPDIRHLRRFFPDGSASRGLARLSELLSSRQKKEEDKRS